MLLSPTVIFNFHQIAPSILLYNFPANGQSSPSQASAVHEPWTPWCSNWIWKRQEISRSTSQFSSVTQSCLTPCNPMDYSMPGMPVHHQLLEFTQTHVHWVGDAIHHLILCGPLLLPPSILHQGLFQWVSSLHQVAKVLEFQLQHQSFQWIFRTDFI